MSLALWFSIASAFLALLYGVWAAQSVLSADAGSQRMQEISGAVQEGANAYLKRQYTTIGLVGLLIFAVVSYLLSWQVGMGYLIGAVLSAAAGFIGMNVSVRANVRTAEAARQGLSQGLKLAFKAGAVTGMLVAGLALLAVSGYYGVLRASDIEGRQLVDALVALGLLFG